MSNYLSDIHCGSFIRARINGVVCICEVLNCLEDSEGRYFQVAPLSDDGLERFYDLAGDFYVYENEILPAGMNFGHNDDLAYKNTGCALLDFFSKAGSLFTNRVSYYGEELSALDLFKLAWAENRKLALKLLFWLRDCRGGAGNRSGFRSILRWLALSHKDWVIANLEFIPVYGRWDDLLVLQGTDCEESAFSFWSRAILAGDSLAAKWAPRARKNRPAFNALRRLAGMGPGEFRRLLSRQTRVVETNLCEKTYSEIDYSKVPSLALGRYNRAFSRHDGDRFSAWKAAVLAGNADIHASVLFPHDVLRTMYSDSEQPSRLAELQFAALPDYLSAKNMRIMPVCDFSGSMEVAISGSIRAIDVSLGLGLYCSDRLGAGNPFFRRFIRFSTDSALVDWRNLSFCEAAEVMNDGYIGSTDIGAALRNILNMGVLLGATSDQMPNCLLIISDMQFDGAVSRSDNTAVESVLCEWINAGYKVPRIVYWNLAGYAGSPARKEDISVAMISGFSPSILLSVFGCEGPVQVMLKTLEKYNLNFL